MSEIERAINFFTGLKFQYADTEHVLKHCDVAIAALTEQAARIDPKPLTLDELMDMNGLPVWCIDGDGHSCYCLVNADNKDCIDSESGAWCFEFFRMTDVGTNRLHKMGWIAYDHPPKEAEA